MSENEPNVAEIGHLIVARRDIQFGSAKLMAGMRGRITRIRHRIGTPVPEKPAPGHRYNMPDKSQGVSVHFDAGEGLVKFNKVYHSGIVIPWDQFEDSSFYQVYADPGDALRGIDGEVTDFDELYRGYPRSKAEALSLIPHVKAALEAEGFVCTPSDLNESNLEAWNKVPEIDRTAVGFFRHECPYGVNPDILLIVVNDNSAKHGPRTTTIFDALKYQFVIRRRTNDRDWVVLRPK